MLEWLKHPENAYGPNGAHRRVLIFRLIISAVIGIAIFSALLFVLAFTRETSELSENVILIAIATVFALWVALLWLIWAGKRRTLTVLLTCFGLFIVWIFTLALCYLWHAVISSGEGLFIAATVTGGAAISIGLVVIALRSKSGDAESSHGPRTMAVYCPGCGYSLVGLHECTCPECGRRFTVDELFAAQR